MLDQCRNTVYDAGPTLIKWMNVFAGLLSQGQPLQESNILQHSELKNRSLGPAISPKI